MGNIAVNWYDHPATRKKKLFLRFNFSFFLNFFIESLPDDIV